MSGVCPAAFARLTANLLPFATLPDCGLSIVAEEFFMPQWLKQSLGALIILLVLLDVFLTVLYARAGTGIFSGRAGCL